LVDFSAGVSLPSSLDYCYGTGFFDVGSESIKFPMQIHHSLRKGGKCKQCGLGSEIQLTALSDNRERVYPEFLKLCPYFP